MFSFARSQFGSGFVGANPNSKIPWQVHECARFRCKGGGRKDVQLKFLLLHVYLATRFWYCVGARTAALLDCLKYFLLHLPYQHVGFRRQRRSL